MNLPVAFWCILVQAVSMTTTKSTAGEVIRAGREQKLWTLRELAEAVTAAGVAVDHSHLSRLERGVSVAKPKLRAALAKTLGVNADDLQ